MMWSFCLEGSLVTELYDVDIGTMVCLERRDMRNISPRLYWISKGKAAVFTKKRK